MDAFVFPGQGAQQRGMGAALFDQCPRFRELEGEVDRLLGYSVRTLCIDDPQQQLGQTAFTQPALYVVNALHYYQAVDGGRRPQCLAGHSLGEYNALLAAGAFDFLTGLRLVQKRGELMSEAKFGGMAAVVGIDAAQLGVLLERHGLDGVDVANFNAPLQTVISGPREQLELAAPLLTEAGARACVMLPVSAAFHSRYMAPAAAAFGAWLADIDFAEPTLPVIANVTARPYRKGAPGAVREMLVAQMASPVQWTRSIRYLHGRGVSAFHEIGPAEVLSRLIRQIQTH
jgi:malonyl CoA-acyl carrier protein transacylase